VSTGGPSFQDRVAALVARQGTPAEDHLLGEQIVSYQPHGTAQPGVNRVLHVGLESGREAFHKPFSGIDVPTAMHYGHHPDEVPLNECAAWRLAHALGHPVSRLVAPCVLRAHEGEAGSLSGRKYGLPCSDEPFRRAPDDCLAAAFFDSLIAQQDRHRGNYRWDSGVQELGLIDHGYSFAVPGQLFNHSAFVAWRRATTRETLVVWERDALQRLLASTDLHGLRLFLEDHRAEAVARRADRMLQTGTILGPGQF
jgi:hypothetical protein